MQTPRIRIWRRRAALAWETVRFYQLKGQLGRPAGEEAAGGRHYGGRDVQRLRYVRCAQAAGFSLAEIAILIDLDRADNRAQARAMACERLSALDAQIAQLRRAVPDPDGFRLGSGPSARSPASANRRRNRG